MIASACKDTRGFTLLELMVTVAVSLTITALSLKGYMAWMERARMSSALSQVEQVASAVAECHTSGTFLGLGMAGVIRCLPPEIGGGTGANPWGGDIMLGQSGDSYRYLITFTGIPEGAGHVMARKVGANIAIYTPATKRVVITAGGAG